MRMECGCIMIDGRKVAKCEACARDDAMQIRTLERPAPKKREKLRRSQRVTRRLARKTKRYLEHQAMISAWRNGHSIEAALAEAV